MRGDESERELDHGQVGLVGDFGQLLDGIEPGPVGGDGGVEALRHECRAAGGDFLPTRADLIVAVYRHQVEACAEAGPILLANSSTPHAALARWINLFVDFLVTKHGLAEALQSDDAAFETLHAYFLDRLVPVCAQLLDAAATAGENLLDMDAYELLRGVGNLCIGADNNPRYDARRMVELVIAGLRLPE